LSHLKSFVLLIAAAATHKAVAAVRRLINQNMTYRTNAQGAVMSSMDGRIWIKLPPRLDRRMKRRWGHFRFTFWTPLLVVFISTALLPIHFA
jgi:hypothetical protein